MSDPVLSALADLQATAAVEGHDTAAVMALTSLSAAELADLGGVVASGA